MYAMCKICMSHKKYALGRVSLGSVKKHERCTTNLRAHMMAHHREEYDKIITADMKSAPRITASMSKVVTNGAPKQVHEETMDALVQIVAEDLDPWIRTQSSAFKKFATSIHPAAIVPSVPSLQAHAALKVMMMM